MMQEAKKSCYGLWYLPAGRMELNETIEVGHCDVSSALNQVLYDITMK